MLNATTDLAEAVFFFDNSGNLCREMLYSEFEAILDSVVPIVEFSGRRMRAVYLQVDHKLLVRSAVLFYIAFDAEGNADRSWNVPVQKLAENAGKGPDLGAGPIRLACHSQCCIEWHKENLWNPDMAASHNTFVAIRKAVASNRIGLVFAEDEEDDVAAAQGMSAEAIGQLSAQYKQQFEQQFRDRMAAVLREQRLRIATIKSQAQQAQQKLQLEHQRRLEEYREALQSLQEQLAQSEQRNGKLKQTIDGQADKIQGLRDYFEQKLRAVSSDEKEQLALLQKNYELELNARVEAATVELKQQLEMREFELSYRTEQEASLGAEIEQLRQENQNLINNSGDQLLDKLAQAGLSFVAYHPGVGNLTVGAADVASYLEDAESFVAKAAGVSVGHYRQWLSHYHTPRCQALTKTGEVCSASIDRVERPSEFHLGESDRCSDHRTSSSQLFAIVN